MQDDKDPRFNRYKAKPLFPASHIYSDPNLLENYKNATAHHTIDDLSHKPFVFAELPLKTKIACLLSLVSISGCILLFLIYTFLSPINRLIGLPDVRSLAAKSTANSSIEIYDKNNQFVCVLQGKEDRQIVSLNQVATPLKQALIVSEDRSFYKHKGINFFNIMRATWVNLTHGEIKQGASTLTQQLIKNVYFKPEEWRTIKRKLQEMPLALEAEKLYTKDEILTFYLNRVFWGKNVYGIERASQRYFNKKANEINIAESAYLVAVLSAPSRLHKTPTAFALQKKIILDMEEFEYITADQAEEALKYKLIFQSAPSNLSKYPYYMSVVLKELESRYTPDELSQGLKVYTRLDPKSQEAAEKKLAQGLKNAPWGITQGALVTIDVETGDVRSIVGGVGNFWDNQWNRATSNHTLGSSFKPFVYLTAFMRGALSADSNIMDTPLTYLEPDTGKEWEPQNFDKKFWGKITVRKALMYSRNIPAIKTAQKATVPEIVKTAQKVGIKVDPYLSIALGSSAGSPLQLANAYASLARGGIYMNPTFISKIVNKDGKTIESNNNVPSRIFPSNSVYELLDILKDVVSSGTGTAARLPGIEVAGKTGTADGSRDIWFVGLTPNTVTVLWAGNDENQKASSRATGGSVLAPIWRSYMSQYTKYHPPLKKSFQRPAKRIKLLIDPITGLKATAQTLDPIYESFVPGTEPTQYAPKPTDKQIQNYLEEKVDELEYIYQKKSTQSLEPLIGTLQKPIYRRRQPIRRRPFQNNNITPPQYRPLQGSSPPSQPSNNNRQYYTTPYQRR